MKTLFTAIIIITVNCLYAQQYKYNPQTHQFSANAKAARNDSAINNEAVIQGFDTNKIKWMDGTTETVKDNKTGQWVQIMKWTNGDFRSTDGKSYNIQPMSEGLALFHPEQQMYGIKLGYVDYTGRVVIPCQFQDAKPFHDGLAIVNIEGKYGIIDKNGKLLGQAKYEEIENFHIGLALVEVNRYLWGYINRSGYEIIPAQFTKATDFTSTIKDIESVKPDTKNFEKYLLPNGHYAFVTKAPPVNNASTFPDKDNTQGLEVIDSTGKEIPFFTRDYVGEFHNGWAFYMDNKKYGWIDSSDNIKIPAKYDDVEGMFNEGLAFVKLNDKYGYVDFKGNEVISIKYDGVGEFHDGRAWFALNGKVGYLDNTGNEVIPANNYYKTGDFHNGLAFVAVQKTEKHMQQKCYGCTYGNNGKIISGTPVTEEETEQKVYYGFIDKTGNVSIPYKYSNAGDFDKGKAQVTLPNGNMAYIDEKGNILK